jgi:catechol 2,3-dioxygenase-like lactoylglutathione lyase family enzyme
MVAGSAKLFLFQTWQEYPHTVKRGLGLFKNPPGLDHISFLVSDVDQIYSGLKTNGVVFSNEPADQDWGARVVSLRDPDGNNLYFCNGSKMADDSERA